MKGHLLVSLLVAVAVAPRALATPPSGDPADVSVEAYVEHVRFLASDELGGRGNGTPGLERAAAYIAAHFERLGLQPGGESGTWFQPFRIVTPEVDTDGAGRKEADPRAGGEQLQVRNVVGVVPGSDPTRAHEAVVVGAHYDHLGLGGSHSLAPEARGEIHNGADDNASGTAALLELARLVSASRGRFPRTTVFVAFAGEELGLLGSAHYVEQPTVPLERTVAMVNLDMVGRPEGRILLTGTEAAPSLVGDVEAAATGRAIEVQRFEHGAGASDDTSFIRRGVPSVAFFSGYHADYHRPTDDWHRLDVQGAVEVTRIALALTQRLSARAERPVLATP